MPRWKDVPENLRRRFPAPPDPKGYSSQEEYEEARGYWQSHVGRSLGLAMRSYREQPRKLLYRVVPHNGGVVFAEPDRALFVASLHRAINGARTWGEFLSAVPESEREEILAQAFDDLGEPRPRETDAFLSESVPGWTDGEYPPWLQKELDSVLPAEVLNQYGKATATSINGTYWHIRAEDLQLICGDLVHRGFQLEETTEEPFH